MCRLVHMDTHAGLLVSDCITALTHAGYHAEWYNTGGGCMAVRVEVGEAVSLPGGWDTHRIEVLITDRDDTFSEYDYTHDDYVGGFLVGVNVLSEVEQIHTWAGVDAREVSLIPFTREAAMSALVDTVRAMVTEVSA